MTKWAVRNKLTDSISDEQIKANQSHYQLWGYNDVYENGKLLFNDDFLGKWRSAETRPLYRGYCHDGTPIKWNDQKYDNN